MKITSRLLIILAMIAITWSAQAQYDDVYYDGSSIASRKKIKVSTDYTTSNYSNQDEVAYDDTNSDYDNDSYNYYDEYSYTNRIRRFQRPLVGRGFYDSYYLDPWNFDPFYYTAGFGLITPSFGIGFYSYNDYNRWNRWHRYNNLRYWDPWTYNYWSYNPYGFNSYSNLFWASNGWCPSSWYSNRYYSNSAGYYSNNNYWGNTYNGAYQPRYYTDNNVHFGPRTYGATTTSDRGPSRTTSRVFSDPGSNPNTGLGRVSPRDVTTVRERNTPITRNPSGSTTDGTTSGVNGRMSPRNNDVNVIRERNQTNERVIKTYRDYNENGSSNGSLNNGNDNSRISPRSNDNTFGRSKNQDYTPQRQSPNDGKNDNEGLRSNSPRTFSSPRQQEQSPRFNSPRQESPRFEAPRQQSPRFESPRQQSNPTYNSPRVESPRSSGGDNGGGARSSGGSSGGAVRSSPRNNK
ncbi:MAG: hypothetical protein ABI844_15090 [Saprospiraceae bacterium]